MIKPPLIQGTSLDVTTVSNESSSALDDSASPNILSGVSVPNATSTPMASDVLDALANLTPVESVDDSSHKRNRELFNKLTY